jgi:small subunit ribosomal protein S6
MVVSGRSGRPAVRLNRRVHKEEVKIVRPYEMMVLLSPDMEEPREEVTKIEEVVRNLGGEIVKSDVLGKKKLAYPIDKKTEGVYALLYFKLEPTQTFELKRVLGLRSNIWRQLILLNE